MAFLLRVIGDRVVFVFFFALMVLTGAYPKAPVLLFQGVSNPPPMKYPGSTLNSDDQLASPVSRKRPSLPS
jgi:hypothetical protein